MYNTCCACVQTQKYCAKCEYQSVNTGSVVRILKCCAKRSVNTKVGKSRWLPPSSSHLLTPLSSPIYDTSSSSQNLSTSQHFTPKLFLLQFEFTFSSLLCSFSAQSSSSSRFPIADSINPGGTFPIPLNLPRPHPLHCSRLQ